jgi:general secretion pathway protein D
MINAKLNLRHYLTWTIALCWIAAMEVQAQRTTTGVRTPGVNRGTGAARSGGGGAAGARQYYPNSEVGEAMISADPETRRLIVITDDETSQYISQVITNLDQPKPQVLIKVVFLEVTYNKGFDIGVEGSYTRNFGGGTTGTFQNVFGLANQGTGPIPPGAGLYQLMGTDFTATLRAIAQAGKTEVLSRPSILARNNQQAVITVGQEIPLVTDTRFDANNNQINTIQYQDIGIILRVTPFITSDGMVEMIVSPEISNLTDQSIPISGGTAPVSAPVIAKRSADTVVVTADGQTVIIGGLMANTKTVSDSKIPFFGDIPGLGILFKRKANMTAKTELMIFLTPHIVGEASQLARLTTQEKQDAKLIPKSFTDEDLDRFVDGLPKAEDKPKNSKK